MTLSQVEQTQPDTTGIIHIDGRRFVKDKLMDWITRNADTCFFDAPKPPEVKVKKVKKAVKPVAIPGKGIGLRRPVIATLPDGTEIPFPSIKQAGTELNINHTNIPKVCCGKYKTVCGIQFRYAEAV